MKKINTENISLQEVPALAVDRTGSLPVIPEKIIINRINSFREAFLEKGIDAAVVYADREHYSNFQYLTGIEPRFEETLIVITKEKNYLLMGNECSNLSKLTPVEHTLIHCPEFSLPNQPMEGHRDLAEIFEEIGLTNMKTGVVGWKLFTERHGKDYKNMFCIPSFIIEALKKTAGSENLVNITDILINPVDGLRLFNTADDIAYFEYGATVVSEGITELMNGLKDGMSELEAASYLQTKGMPIATHPMVTFGANCFRGLISPGNEKLTDGCEFNVNIGLRGGLTSRGGYAAESRETMKSEFSNFEDIVAKPYFAAVAAWYENIGIGVNAGELYDFIEAVFPKKTYGWVLNAGHFLGTEEWLSSSSFHGSNAVYQSGQMVQADLIPSVEGYISPNMEDGIAIADADLRAELEDKYPDTYKRIMKRRDYMQNVLGIELKPEILPMSNLCGIYTPYFKDWKKTFTIR